MHTYMHIEHGISQQQFLNPLSWRKHKFYTILLLNNLADRIQKYPENGLLLLPLWYLYMVKFMNKKCKSVTHSRGNKIGSFYHFRKSVLYSSKLNG